VVEGWPDGEIILQIETKFVWSGWLIQYFLLTLFKWIDLKHRLTTPAGKANCKRLKVNSPGHPSFEKGAER
ncbi:MAG: hypothetical protein WAL29_04195, partial [Bacteroidales bacterium]